LPRRFFYASEVVNIHTFSERRLHSVWMFRFA
jgi:hypothetical protein